MNIEPLFDNVVIKPIELKSKTAGGIVLPDTSKEETRIGKIVAVGPGKLDESKIGVSNPMGPGVPNLIPMFVNVGQKVIYKKWAGNEIKMNGKDYLIVEQKDILAIVE